MRRAAISKLTDQDLLGEVAMESKNDSVRLAAVERLTDQDALAKVAMEDPYLPVRLAAVERLTDQESLRKVAIEGWPEPVRRAAFVRHETVRLEAVGRMTDQDALVKVAMEDPYVSVSLVAVEGLTDQDLLRKLATEDVHVTVRRAAISKLTDQDLLGKLAMASKNDSVRLAAVERMTDQDLLVKLAMESKVAAVRIAAAKRLTDQNMLARVVVESRKKEVWEVRHAAFQRLNEGSWAAVARRSKDPAVALAVRIRLGQSDWDQAFGSARRGKNALCDVLGAAALVESPRAPRTAVVPACYDCIREGGASRIPELRALLFRYGDVSLAQHYTNSGRIELEAAGWEWAKQHGYQVMELFGLPRLPE